VTDAELIKKTVGEIARLLSQEYRLVDLKDRAVLVEIKGRKLMIGIQVCE
jgi:hypothetical protein